MRELPDHVASIDANTVPATTTIHWRRIGFNASCAAVLTGIIWLLAQLATVLIAGAPLAWYWGAGAITVAMATEAIKSLIFITKVRLILRRVRRNKTQHKGDPDA